MTAYRIDRAVSAGIRVTGNPTAEPGGHGAVPISVWPSSAGPLLAVIGLWVVTIGAVVVVDQSGAPAASFAPARALVGGAMIGLSAVLLMALVGRIAGISGIAARMLPPFGEQGALGSLAFISGLGAAPAASLAATGSWPAMTLEAKPVTLVLAGLLVGFGSVWGAGCTSGHGVCGQG